MTGAQRVKASLRTASQGIGVKRPISEVEGDEADPSIDEYGWAEDDECDLIDELPDATASSQKAAEP